MKTHILTLCFVVLFVLGTTAQTTSENVLTVADEMPQFNGELSAYLGKQLMYPAAAKEAGIEGKVIVQFVVKRDGTLENIEIVRSENDDFTKEVKRVVALMPAWKPGKQNGKSVAVKMTLPVVFKLEDVKKKK